MTTSIKQAIYAQTAKARLVYYKEKGTYKIVIAFNVYETQVSGKFKFPPQRRCDYVSGDLNYATLEADIERVVALAKTSLSTDNIIFV